MDKQLKRVAKAKKSVEDSQTLLGQAILDTFPNGMRFYARLPGMKTMVVFRVIRERTVSPEWMGLFPNIMAMNESTGIIRRVNPTDVGNFQILGVE